MLNLVAPIILKFVIFFFFFLNDRLSLTFIHLWNIVMKSNTGTVGQQKTPFNDRSWISSVYFGGSKCSHSAKEYFTYDHLALKKPTSTNLTNISIRCQEETKSWKTEVILSLETQIKQNLFDLKKKPNIPNQANPNQPKPTIQPTKQTNVENITSFAC